MKLKTRPSAGFYYSELIMAIEIELRGPLTKIGYRRLISFFKKEAEFVKEMKRKSFLFDIKDQTIDLKVRTTDGVPEIVLKKGFWGAKRREEILLPIRANTEESAIRLFALLGFSKGGIAVRESHIFNYHGIEFSVVKCPKGVYYYEAEFISNKKTANPERHIEGVLKSLDLKIWSDKEFLGFLKVCNKINKRFHHKV